MNPFNKNQNQELDSKLYQYKDFFSVAVANMEKNIEEEYRLKSKAISLHVKSLAVHRKFS